MSFYDNEMYNYIVGINEAWDNASFKKLLRDSIDYIKISEQHNFTKDHGLYMTHSLFPYLEYGEIAKFFSNDVLSNDMKKEKLRYAIAEYLNSEFEGEVKPESLKNENSVPVLNTTFDIDLDDTDINIGNNLERMLYVQVDLVNYQYIYALDTEIVSSEQVSLDQMIDEFQSMTFGDLYEHALNVVYPKAIEQYNSINYIKSISENEAAKIFNSEHGGKYDYLGKFIIKENDGYTAIDNSTGDAWTEEFNNEADAIRYLNNEYQNELDKVSSSIEVGDLIRITLRNTQYISLDKGNYIVYFLCIG